MNISKITYQPLMQISHVTKSVYSYRKLFPLFRLKHKGNYKVTDENKNIAASKYKYSGKEWNDELGLNLYDFHARNYDPAIGRWLSVDPLAEIYRNIGGYVYVANNPINFIDPTGMHIEPGSQKEWDKNKQNVIGQRDKLQGKINDLNATASKKGWSSSKLAEKIGDMQERVNSLNESINNLTILENSSQTYSLSKVSNSNIGGLTYDKNSGNINIGFDGTTSNFVHETTHGGQFEAGDMAFDINSGLGLAQDLNDEVSAYKAQYSYDPSTTGGKNLSTINAAWVKTISPPLYDRHGVIPVNINSTTQDLLRAYPNDTNLKGINNLNPTERARQLKFKLKEYPNVYYKK